MAQAEEKKTKRFTLRFGAAGLMISSLIMVIVLAWFFVLGVLVGRGDIPDPFDLPYLKKLAWKVNVAADPGVTVTKPEQARSVQAQKGPAEQPEPDIDLNFFSDVEKKRSVVTGIIPKEGAESEESSSLYTVQLASFKDGQKAQKFVEDMAGKDVNCYISPAKSKDVQWFRIRTGRFDSLESAQAMVADLDEKLGIKTMAVKIK